MLNQRSHSSYYQAYIIILNCFFLYKNLDDMSECENSHANMLDNNCHAALEKKFSESVFS
jgi:hypothetical protein